jgi:hypothetical protein
MCLPQISHLHETRLDAPRNKTQKAAVIKRLRMILPQKKRQRQSLERLLFAPAQAANASHGGLVPERQPDPRLVGDEVPAAAVE